MEQNLELSWDLKTLTFYFILVLVKNEFSLLCDSMNPVILWICKRFWKIPFLSVSIMHFMGNWWSRIYSQVLQYRTHHNSGQHKTQCYSVHRLWRRALEPGNWKQRYKHLKFQITHKLMTKSRHNLTKSKILGNAASPMQSELCLQFFSLPFTLHRRCNISKKNFCEIVQWIHRQLVRKLEFRMLHELFARFRLQRASS